jgi:hypothetical protein
MKKIILPVLFALPLILCSCATPPPPVAFHKTDNAALVIDSLDNKTARIVQPGLSVREDNNRILTEAKSVQPRHTAVVILENYTEAQPGEQFRDRSVDLFFGLRALGYEHIYFLQGKGVPNPENLLTVVEYK